MATMDIFNSNAFGLMELTGTLSRVPYIPQQITNLRLFEVERLRTENVTVEFKDHEVSLIQTDTRGEEINKDTKGTKRKLRSFPTTRLADAATINAGEIAGVRAYGSESEFQQVADLVAERLTGPGSVREKFELTWEHMRLGAVQGIVLDADGTEIINWYDELGLSEAAEIDFDLDNASPARGALRKKCNALIRSIATAAKGAWVPGQSRVQALVGETFFDQFITHDEVREAFLNWSAAADLGGSRFDAYGVFPWGGIDWMEYRGTDDGSTVSVGATKARFFPKGVRGQFKVAFAPGETFGSINMPGQEMYARRVLDPGANGNFEEAMWVRFEEYSYPLFLCMRPDLLRKGRNT